MGFTRPRMEADLFHRETSPALSCNYTGMRGEACWDARRSRIN